MGYTTDFEGSFSIDPPLKPEHAAYLRKFRETRRMQRDEDRTELLDDPIRKAANLPIGKEGAFFVGGTGDFGQGMDDGILDFNNPPGGSPYRDTTRPEWAQPGLWCQWTPNEDGTALEWDRGEKFYSYTEWLQYIIDNFMIRWGYELNGEVTWQGEESGDIGTITVKTNEVVSTKS